MEWVMGRNLELENSGGFDVVSELALAQPLFL